MREKAVFITGATGFVGRNMLARMAASPAYRDLPIFALVRRNIATSRCAPPLRIVAMPGDIRSGPSLGLSPRDSEILRRYELEVWHVAGSTQFADAREEEIFQTNTVGTENVVRFAVDARCRCLHHMSTAYVAGDRGKTTWGGSVPVVYEQELDVGQRLRNPYEQSKLAAEVFVRNAARAFALPVRIYRISIAVGRSDTGVTTSFTGYYAYMRGWRIIGDWLERERRRAAEGGMPFRYSALPQATINIVCIDYAVDTIVRLAEQSASEGRTFHIVNPHPPRFGWLLKTGLEVLGVEGVEIRTEERRPSLPANTEGKIRKALGHYLDYTEGEPVFDMSAVAEVLGGIPAHPVTDEQLVSRLLGYALSVDFGSTSRSCRVRGASSSSTNRARRKGPSRGKDREAQGASRRPTEEGRGSGRQQEEGGAARGRAGEAGRRSPRLPLAGSEAVPLRSMKSPLRTHAGAGQGSAVVCCSRKGEKGCDPPRMGWLFVLLAILVAGCGVTNYPLQTQTMKCEIAVLNELFGSTTVTDCVDKKTGATAFRNTAHGPGWASLGEKAIIGGSIVGAAAVLRPSTTKIDSKSTATAEGKGGAGGAGGNAETGAVTTKNCDSDGGNITGC